MDKNAKFYFTSKDIEIFFGISRKVLYYWRKIGIFEPKNYTKGNHHRYTFRDLVAIKTILELKEQGISTYKIKKFISEAKNIFPDIRTFLTEKKLYVIGNEIYISDSKMSFNPVNGQGTFITPKEIEKKVKTIALKCLNIPSGKYKTAVEMSRT